MSFDTRAIECPQCGGDGGWETLTHYDPRNGEPRGYWTQCPTCDGRREIEIEVFPIEMVDLDEPMSEGCCLSGGKS